MQHATRAVYLVLENFSKAVQHELFIWCWRTLARLCNTSCLSSAGEIQQGCATRAVYLVLENLSKAMQHATRAVYLVLENFSKAVQHELFIRCWRTSARLCNTSYLSGFGEPQQGCATRAVYLVLENLSKAVQHELFIWCWRTSARPTRTPHACCE